MSETSTSSVQGAIQGFTPITRKIFALGLLFLALFFFWTAILAPVLSQMDAGLSELSDARFQRMRLEQIQNRPALEPVEALPAGLVVSTETPEEAQSALSAQINALAMQNGMELVVSPRPIAKGSQLIIFDVSAAASEINIIGFINSLERGNPMMRFRNWQIDSAMLSGNMDAQIAQDPGSEALPPVVGSTVADGNIQFSGEIVGAWIKS